MAIDEAPINVADVQFRPIRFGPWKGSVRSTPADRVPPEFMAESDSDTPSSNYSFNPHYGTWFRRLGQTIKFDTLPTAAGVGLLPAKWSARCRKLEEFNSEAVTDSIPTMAALLTKETLTDTTLVDDGRFSNLWVRDQVNSLNYTVGSDYSATTYPAPGSVPTYKVIPLWHGSGDGGMVRGTTEFEQRFFFGGSRQFLKVGNWMYHPSYFGTPSRWRGMFTPTAALIQTATPDGYDPNFAGPGGEWAAVGGPSTLWECVDDSGADTAGTDYASLTPSSGTGSFYCSLSTVTDPGVNTGFVLKLTLRSNHAATNSHLLVEVSNRAAATWMTAKSYGSPTDTTGTTTQGLVTGSFVEYTIAISAAEAANATFGNHWTVTFSFSGAPAAGGTWDIAAVKLTLGSTTTSLDNRLIPSGPIPACHAGSLAAGQAVSGSSAADFERPDADDTDGSWLNTAANNTDLYSYIDESTTDDTDYITLGDGLASSCIVRLSNFSSTPAAGDTVTLTVRAKRTVSGGIFGGIANLAANVTEGGTVRLAMPNFVPTTSYANYVVTMTSTQVTAVTDWTNLKLSIGGDTTVTTGTHALFVSQAFLTFTPGVSEGAWQGSDRFFYGVVPIFEDDSYWMPTIPRFPNTLLANGYNLFTVDANNLTTSYGKITWSNIPILWYGNRRKALVRSDKIDSTLTDNLALQPLKLRIVAIVDNAVTTYDDYAADDDSLQLDPAGLLVRYDHIMPPRARYIFGGDMRICHSYGTVNPCAIIIAPVGRTADYDLNLADDAAALYTADASYMRVTIDTAGTSKLELSQADGSASVTDTTSFDFATYTTLEKLVDAINATNCASNGQQWRAQLCPGVDPNAVPTTHLAAHKRVLASITTTNNSTTITGTGLGKVAIGSRVSGSGITAGTYVTKINSSTSLTLSVVATASASVTLTFYQEFGDSPTTATANTGWQRVIAQSLPGFLYFNRTYLDQFTTEKSSIWMTTASPGSTKSAPNCFSGKVSNKFFPPNAKAGKAMGGVGIRQGFRVLFENQRGIIDNTAHQGSGLDEEYRLKITHDSSGCCSWSSIAAGTNFAVYAAPEGIIAGDLDREILLSDAIWNPPSSDAPTGTGDFSYEIPQSIAATAADNDNAMLYCSIIRDVLRVNYRTSGSTTHPDRQVVYDFSSGTDQSGLQCLFHQGKEPWGWSTPFSRAVTCVGEGRRGSTDSGAHVYGWNDANAQSTGDGRIDEIDTGQTDNGTAISASMTTPWIRPGSRKLSFHRFVAEHATPSGATAAFDFHRSIADETYSLTPSTSSALYIRDWKELTLPARAPTAAGFFGFRQSAGTAQEIRSLEVYVEELDTYS